MSNNIDSFMLKKILSIPNTSEKPTPSETADIKIYIELIFENSATWVASIVMSGSANVIINPITKLVNKTIKRFLHFDNVEPTPSPNSIIAESAPRVNSAVPKIKNTALIKSFIILSIVVGANKNIIAKITTVIGNIELNESFNLR